MAVHSRPLKSERRDWMGLTFKLGTWLVLIGAGGLVWVWNGAYSVRGMGWLATLLPATTAFWQWAIAWQVTIGGQSIAVVPWSLVVGTSFMQFSLIARIADKRYISPWQSVVGFVLSAFDLVTTFFGLSDLTWIMGGRLLLQAPLAAFLTGAVETSLGLLLRRRI